MIYLHYINTYTHHSRVYLVVYLEKSYVTCMIYMAKDENIVNLLTKITFYITTILSIYILLGCDQNSRNHMTYVMLICILYEYLFVGQNSTQGMNIGHIG